MWGTGGAFSILRAVRAGHEINPEKQPSGTIIAKYGACVISLPGTAHLMNSCAVRLGHADGARPPLSQLRDIESRCSVLGKNNTNPHMPLMNPWKHAWGGATS